MSLFCGYEHSNVYAAFRPTYPLALFKNLASMCPSRQIAWDVACGTGQATSSLGSLFEKVIGTDLAQSQLDHSIKGDNIFYYKCSAEADHKEIEEKLNVQRNSIDLITVAQALHWFNLDSFYSTIRHFLKPEGVLAVWTYTWPTITDSPDLTRLLHEMANGILGPYWAPERKIVDNQYRDVPFPFTSVVTAIEEPYMTMDVTWTLDGMFGYIRSWSAYNTAIKVLPDDPLEQVREQIISAWGDIPERSVRFPIFLLAGRPQ